MQNARMKTVRLEPDLEKFAGDLNAWQRRELARKFKRWARQLEITALILISASGPRQRPLLRPLPRRNQLLN